MHVKEFDAVDAKKIVLVTLTSSKTYEVDESLVCERKPSNSNVWVCRFRAAVLKDNLVVNQRLRQLSQILSLRNGTITCIVTGKKKIFHRSTTQTN